jgi:hypothetical protein
MRLKDFVKMLNMDTQNEVYMHVYVEIHFLASSHVYFVYLHYCVVACGYSFVSPDVGHMVPLLSVVGSSYLSSSRLYYLQYMKH